MACNFPNQSQEISFDLTAVGITSKQAKTLIKTPGSVDPISLDAVQLIAVQCIRRAGSRAVGKQGREEVRRETPLMLAKVAQPELSYGRAELALSNCARFAQESAMLCIYATPCQSHAES